ncbi:GNAT family N-acetyltransferase [Silanimonas algicola]
MADALHIIHRPERERFEAQLDGHGGVLRYLLRRGEGRPVMVIPSVVVDPAIEGRGVAGALTRAALEWARTEDVRVDPLCPYVEAWLCRHPEFAGRRA